MRPGGAEALEILTSDESNRTSLSRSLEPTDKKRADPWLSFYLPQYNVEGSTDNGNKLDGIGTETCP